MKVSKKLEQCIFWSIMLCLLIGYTCNYMRNRQINMEIAKLEALGFQVHESGTSSFFISEVVNGSLCERRDHVINSPGLLDVTFGKIKAEDAKYVNVSIRTDKEPLILKLEYYGCDHESDKSTYYFYKEIKDQLKILSIDTDRVIKIEQFFSE